MRASFSALLVSLPLAFVTACSQSQKPVPIEEGAVKMQIERNWNVDSGAAQACDQPVELRVSLAPDGSGTVTKVEILPSQPESDACTMVAESARRAILISSPLRLPPDAAITSLKLRFDPAQLLE